MSDTTTGDLLTTDFRPVFCHRDDCEANQAHVFCSKCGADIAAYLGATTGEMPAVIYTKDKGSERGVPEPPTQQLEIVAITPSSTHEWAAPRAAAAAPARPAPAEPDADGSGGAGRRWLTLLNVGIFGACMAAGALSGVAANVI
jgi:hypothetical protein